jgi:lipopolysaccharide export system permease protein
MMRIIDRYLLRQFLTTFLICFLSLMGLYVIIDCSTHIEDFLRCGEKMGGVLKFAGQYYSYKSFAVFDLLNGILVLISAMFTVSWLQRHNEMTALMMAGISRIRIVMPIIAAAVVISLLAAANREFIIPRFRDEMARRPQDLIGDQAQSLDPRYDNQTDVLISGKFTYAENKRIESPDFSMPAPLKRWGKHVLAENAYYQPPEGDRPGGYLFDKVREPKFLDTRSSLLLAGRPVLITPCDRPDWLKPDQCFVASNLDFEQLTGGVGFKNFSSTAQLIDGLGNSSVGFGADVRVKVHARIVQPLLDVTLLFLGLPLVVRRESHNVFLAIGMCMGITTIFLVTVISLQQLGASSIIPSALAAWMPLIIFVPPAVGLSHSMWE